MIYFVCGRSKYQFSVNLFSTSNHCLLAQLFLSKNCFLLFRVNSNERLQIWYSHRPHLIKPGPT